jgi:hypothetical protein
MNGTFRKGFPEAQRGRLIAAAGNGFHVFASETGAEFTVRAEEFTRTATARLRPRASAKSSQAGRAAAISSASSSRPAALRRSPSR